MKSISGIALAVLIGAILYLVISGNLLSPSPFVVAGQLLAVAVGVWARRSFMSGQFSVHAEPAEGQLLSNGPYRYIRHPMYAAALLLVWSSILGHVSPAAVAVGAITTVVIAIRISVEEQFLRARYVGYEDYIHKTKRIIPFLV
jgi:protein-S-isoprenylcysteine O-methyltransferase Ste14